LKSRWTNSVLGLCHTVCGQVEIEVC